MRTSPVPLTSTDMSAKHPPAPGIERCNRISDEGVQRLQKHLQCGTKMQPQVLAQWLKRYGEPVRCLLKQYQCYSEDLEDD